MPPGPANRDARHFIAMDKNGPPCSASRQYPINDDQGCLRRPIVGIFRLSDAIRTMIENCGRIQANFASSRFNFKHCARLFMNPELISASSRFE
jgi:hypothetical protein